MPLVVEAEEAAIGGLVIRGNHSAIPCRDGLENVEAVGACMANGTHRLAVISRAECLCAILDQQQIMLIRDGFQFVQPGGVAQHMHHQDGLGARRDLAPDVLGIEIEGFVHLRQDGNRGRR